LNMGRDVRQSICKLSGPMERNSYGGTGGNIMESVSENSQFHVQDPIQVSANTADVAVFFFQNKL
jgi:hypothetical protein